MQKLKYAICPICNNEYLIMTKVKPKTCGSLSCINEYQKPEMLRTSNVSERPIKDRMSSSWYNFGKS